MEKRLNFLKQVEILSLLSDTELEKISPLLKVHKYSPNEVLFYEGDEGDELYIVESGLVASSITLPDGGERQIASFSRGNFFGEMSIFEKAPRSATCFCLEKSSLVSLHAKDFFDIISRYPEIATRIMYRMLNITTQRLRDTGEFLSDMVQWGEAARKRAITDELTGVYNRRFLDDVLESQFDLARANETELSLIMVDLDYFREINDEFGNETGNSLILQIVEIFNQNLRGTDFLARYGGDEFTVLMPDTGMEDARTIAENIRIDVTKIDFLKRVDGSVRTISISQGIASYPGSAEDLNALKKQADNALYRAKENGRDRVVCADKE